MKEEYRRSQEAARMRQQINAGLEDWVAKRLAENARRPVVEASVQLPAIGLCDDVITKPVILKGGPGMPTSYAQLAEENYTGHSYGGPETPLTGSISLFNDILVWINNSSLIDWMVKKGWLRPNAEAGLCYRPKDFAPIVEPEWLKLAPNLPIPYPTVPNLPNPYPSDPVLAPGGKGLTITGVQATNRSGEVISIARVYINLYGERGACPYLSYQAYPFQYPIIVSPKWNMIQPGDTFRLNIDPVDIRPGQRAKVEISIVSETMRRGSVEIEIGP